MSGRTIGRIGLAIVGTVIGAAVGAPQLGFALGSLVGGLIFPAKGVDVGRRNDDLKVQLSTYGAGRPRTWGTVRTGNNRFWVEGDQIIKRTKTVKQGKGGVKSQVDEFFGVFADYLCDNEIAALHAIIADGKIIYRDGSPLAGQASTGPYIKPGMTFRVYKGTPTQLPDPAIQADRGADRTPAYRGQAYVVFDELPLADFGNRLPTLQYIFSTAVTTVQTGSEYSPAPTVAQSAEFQTFITSDDIIYSRIGTEIVATYVASGVELWRIDLDDGQIYFCFDGVQVDESAGVVYVLLTHISGFGSARLVLIDRFTGTVLSDTTPTIGGARHAEPIYDSVTNAFAGVMVSGGGGSFNTADYQAGSLSFLSSTATFPAVAIDWLGAPNGYFWTASDALLSRGQLNTAGGATPIVNGPTLDISALPGWVTGGERFLKYEPWSGGVWLFSSGRVFLVDPLTMTAQQLLNGGSPLNLSGRAHLMSAGTGDPNTGLDYWYDGAGGILAVDPQTMTASTAFASISTTWSSLAIDTLAVHVFHYSRNLNAIVLRAFSGVYLLYLGFPSPVGVSLKEITDAVSAADGLDVAADINTAALAAIPIGGYAVNDPNITGQSTLEPLFDFRFVDAVEIAGVIHFVPRGGAVIGSIGEDEIGATESSEPGVRLIESLAEDLALPVEMRVTFIDPNRDYQEGTVLRARSADTTSEGQRLTTALPITMQPNDALLYASRKIKAGWEERYALEFDALPMHRNLVPTDVVALTAGDAYYPRVRILDRDITPAGLVRFRGVSDQASVYTLDPALTAPQGSFLPSTPSLNSTSDLRLFDMPALRDQDALAANLFHTGLQINPSFAWKGVTLAVSTDAALYSSFAFDNTSPDRAILSRALAGAPSSDATQNDGLYLKMLAGAAPATVSAADFYKGVNAILIGSIAAGWECVFFQTVTDVGGGEYRLAPLLRGRRGTEHLGVAAWPAGTEIIFPTPIDIEGTDFTVYLDQTIYVRGVEASTGANTLPKSLTFNGWSALPYSVVDIAGARDGSNNLTIDWNRRARFNNDFRDGLPLIMDEPALEFEIDVLDAPGGNVVDTVQGIGAETHVYSAAAQTAAGLTPGDPVHVEIYQISQALRRRGRKKAATI